MRRCHSVYWAIGIVQTSIRLDFTSYIDILRNEGHSVKRQWCHCRTADAVRKFTPPPPTGSLSAPSATGPSRAALRPHRTGRGALLTRHSSQPRLVLSQLRHVCPPAHQIAAVPLLNHRRGVFVRETEAERQRLPRTLIDKAPGEGCVHEVRVRIPVGVERVFAVQTGGEVVESVEATVGALHALLTTDLDDESAESGAEDGKHPPLDNTENEEVSEYSQKQTAQNGPGQQEWDRFHRPICDRTRSQIGNVFPINVFCKGSRNSLLRPNEWGLAQSESRFS